MYSAIYAALISVATFGERHDRRPANLPAEFAELDEHTLRDIGFIRERPTKLRRHLMRF
jgi:hypothetical protein